MSSITFGTHRFVRRLREAGFDEKQAEALTEAMRSAIDESELVTKKDLQIELAPVRADLTMLKWMSGLVLGGIVTLIVKGFMG